MAFSSHAVPDEHGQVFGRFKISSFDLCGSMPPAFELPGKPDYLSGRAGEASTPKEGLRHASLHRVACRGGFLFFVAFFQFL